VFGGDFDEELRREKRRVTGCRGVAGEIGGVFEPREEGGKHGAVYFVAWKRKGIERSFFLGFSTKRKKFVEQIFGQVFFFVFTLCFGSEKIACLCWNVV
jgi:hypothetical protein